MATPSEFASKEIQRIDNEGLDKSKSTPLDEEGLRKQIPPFHSDPDKIKEYHSFLLLRQVEICNWCSWRNPNFPIEPPASIGSFNGVDDAEMIRQLTDASLYGSYSGKRELRVRAYFRCRELGWSHEKIKGIMGRWQNPITLDGYKDTYDAYLQNKKEYEKVLKKN